VSHDEESIQYYKRRLEGLKAARCVWEPLWRELSDLIAPTRLRLCGQVANERARYDKMFDATGSFALRILASGMHSGITSPARPWFRLRTSDSELNAYAPVREYLGRVENRMREVFQSSNLYNAFHLGYGDLGLFGQSCALLVEDDDHLIRMIPLIHGTFWLARNHTQVATTLYRQFSWPLHRIVSRFGLERCSGNIQEHYERGNMEEVFVINHAIEPRLIREMDKADRRNKAFASVYWEENACGEQGFLEESGFDSNPIIAPAWELMADDTYASSPAMMALPDVRALRILQMQMGAVIQLKVNPPLMAPASLKSGYQSVLRNPGELTYIDDPTAHGLRPLFEVNLSLQELAANISEKQMFCKRALYEDLFLMLANMEGVQPRNAMEIAERKEEKLLAIGPVLENIHGGQLSPVIERTFSIMKEKGLLPPAPPEIGHHDLKIEYISVLAQAQKAVSTGAIERLISFTGNLVAVKPDVLDKIDADKSVETYAELLGVPPSLLASDDEVTEIRRLRDEAQQHSQATSQAAQIAPALRQSAEAARVMTQADENGGTLLEKMGIE